MMGPRQEAQGALFYEFSIEDHVPQDHILRVSVVRVFWRAERFSNRGSGPSLGLF